MKKLMLSKTVCITFVFCIATVIGSHAQTFTTLTIFNGTNGWGPTYMSLIQGTDGNFYGTTFGAGGSGSNGSTVFKITRGGTLTTLYTFPGSAPPALWGGVVQATNGNFYGVTDIGGVNGDGTVFKLTAQGQLTMLHSFNGSDGYSPFAALVQGTDGNFYGTTMLGGVNGGDGTVFKITPTGSLTTLHSFNGTDGSFVFGGLVQANDGNFYGTTQLGGAYCVANDGCGTVFKITPAGALTTLHSFDGNDGSEPYGTLIQATNGSLYGTTSAGGAHGYGTIFEISPEGTFTTLYNFCAQANCSDGATPVGALVQATDGNFYGTTEKGGTSNNSPCDISNGCGTVFRITAAGKLTTLHSFDWNDGAVPYGGLVQATNGTFYGTTDSGGDNGGTVFSLSVGLGPFVETRPTSGKVGTAVIILGNNLTGATRVTFNGTAAMFTVVSGTEIKTTVPVRAITGKVCVTTPRGTLCSNTPFRVTPTISSFSDTSGPAGTIVTINGESFTRATSATFGGIKATTFTVDS